MVLAALGTYPGYGRMQPMLQKLKSPQNILQDLVAGLTGAVAGAPQAMGFAILAGVSPLYGLYGAFVTAIVASALSSSTLIVFAPTNALALVSGSTLLGYEGSQQLDVLFLLTMMLGVLMLAVGLLRLGNLTRFVSRAVMTGFITGAGLLIMLGQLNHLTGVEVENSRVPLLELWRWLLALPSSDLRTTLIGLAAIIMIGGLHFTQLRSYATLLAILILTALTLFLGWDTVEVVQDMSEIPQGFPAPFLPDFSLAPELFSTALALSILAAVQSAALITSTREREDGSVNVSRDFSAMGVGNIVGGIFQGMPSCASLSRTAVNLSAGAQTRLSNLSAGAFVGVIILMFGGFIEQVPLAVLAGHLVVAAFSLISIRDLKIVWRVGWAGRAAMMVTLVSALLLPLQYSIYIGVGLSLLLYVYTSAYNIQITRLIPTADGHFRKVDVPEQLPEREIVVLSVHGHLYFAAVHQLERSLPAPEADCRDVVVILRLNENMYLGSTGIDMLERYKEKLEQQGGRLILVDVEQAVRSQLERTRALAVFGEENVYFANEVVLGATEDAYKDAQVWLAAKQPQL